MTTNVAARPRREETGAEPDHVVTISGLTKRYRRPDGGDFTAVDGLDLEVRRGEVLAILGPNGAGKTTTHEIVEGLTTADGGSVRVLGMDAFTQITEVHER